MAGCVQLLSAVVSTERPSAPLATLAVHTSPGDRNTWKSSRSSELAAPRKRTFTALPFTVSVFTTLSSVALPFWAVK